MFIENIDRGRSARIFLVVFLAVGLDVCGEGEGVGTHLIEEE